MAGTCFSDRLPVLPVDFEQLLELDLKGPPLQAGLVSQSQLLPGVQDACGLGQLVLDEYLALREWRRG